VSVDPGVVDFDAVNLLTEVDVGDTVDAAGILVRDSNIAEVIGGEAEFRSMGLQVIERRRERSALRVRKGRPKGKPGD
jgi:hypothetical protein